MTGNKPSSRPGPRPLPLHLTNALATWMSAAATLPLVKTGAANWHPTLKAEAEQLIRAIPDQSWPEFETAVAEQCNTRLREMMAGISAYQNHPWHREMKTPDVAMEAGSSRLCRHAEKGVPLLVIPSLINPSCILDLTREKSFVRALAISGFNPYLVDWGPPGAVEQGFGLTDYVLRLEYFLAHIREVSGEEPCVIGYCMGGNLALALAARQPTGIRKLALLATPWDFHADRSGEYSEFASLVPLVRSIAETTGSVPVDILQVFFASLDPSHAEKKFRHFAGIDPDSEQARLFVAIEDWANSGAPLAGKVAMECLQGWYLNNVTGRGQWKIDGKTVNPASIEIPVFLAVPESDRVVPEKSALALADHIPDVEILRTPSGHIGMMIGRKAKTGLWDPLADWLAKK